jgi:cysteine desulfurase
VTKRVYLDWNATTPPLPAVVEAMREAALEAWGNPASIHGEGRAARKYVEDARAAVAALADADPRDVVLTSGGTEANNLALRTAFADASAGAPGTARRTLVLSALEHPSVTRVAEALAEEGRARLRWLGVLPDGSIDLDDVDRALAEPDVHLVSVQAVNHETGAIHPVVDIAARAFARGARTHVDAVQAWGKVPMSGMNEPGAVTTRSLAGHKIRGPKGIGAVILAPHGKLVPVLRGGAQERGLRPGTVDPVACAGLAVAARHALGGAARLERARPLRDRLVAGLLALDPSCTCIRPPGWAPHVANVAFARVDGPEMVAALDLEGIAIASGSACSAGTNEPSAGITAMLGKDRARRSLRLSLGEDTTDRDVDQTLAAFAGVLAR